jgi:hypothetical protein
MCQSENRTLTHTQGENIRAQDGNRDALQADLRDEKTELPISQF